jgi:NAD(P)-dependent dehydrogenase (short-subunit alcohol dehydrogenase family)
LSGTVVITGAGSGIGRAACEVFADAGFTVLAVDLHEDTSAAAAADIGGASLAGDVSDPALWDRVVAAAGDDLRAVYLNAGVYGHNGAIEDLPLDVLQRTIDTNIGGVVLGTRACVPALRANGGGAIVVTASVAGVIAFGGNPLYTLTKQAVAGFVAAVAPSLEPQGISIDAVCPGVVDTPMTEGALGGLDPKDLGIEMVGPEVIAQTALDLATSEGTGRCRVVRAGYEPVDYRHPIWQELGR